MEAWHEYAGLFRDSAEVAALIALAVALLAYFGLRLLHTVPRWQKHRTWKSDTRPLPAFFVVTFTLIAVPGIAIGLMFTPLCGTSQSRLFPSPDNQHKLVIYAFDCGATTDFSLVVSLLKTNETLPKHHRAAVLYSRYHQQPVDNFEVRWKSAWEVQVRIADLQPHPPVTQDGVTVVFDTFP